MNLKNNHLPFLASPLPGEILSSIIARSAKLLGIKPLSYLKNEMGIKSYSPFVCNYLDSFKSFSWVYNTYTVYPYYLFPLKYKDKEKVINDLRNPKKRESRRIMSSDNTLKKKNLFYCSDCLREDIKSYGTGYFHLIHQYEGITACSKHKKRLIEFKGDRFFPILTEKEIVPAAIADNQELILADNSEMLNSFCQEELTYFLNIHIQSLLKSDKYSSREEILNQINHWIETTYLGKKGFRFKRLTLDRMLRNKDKPVSPVFYIIYTTVFSISPEQITKTIIESISTKVDIVNDIKVCRNTLCNSAEVKEIGKSPKGNNYYRCSECNMVFSKSRIKQLGLKGRNLILEATRNRTLTLTELALNMNLNKASSLSRILKRDPEKFDKTLRLEREKALKHKTLKNLKRENKSLYNKLISYDKEWLYENMERSKRVFPKNSNKDLEKLNLMKIAYEEAISENVWINKNFLIHAMGLKDSNMNEIKKRYPKCHKFIEEHIEVIENSWTRRIKLFIDNYDFKVPLTLATLNKGLGITGSPIVSNIYKLMGSYIQHKEREVLLDETYR